ncbi:MAG: transglycosylase SLT domain-containing protein [Treponema sp.]
MHKRRYIPSAVRHYFVILCLGCAPYLALWANVTTGWLNNESDTIDSTLLDDLQRSTLLKNTLIFSDHHLITRFRKQYLTEDGRNYLSKIMQRSTPYRKFIIKLLEAEHMPKELFFLPVIESGFFEKAHSKAGAAGIWQFMKNSVSGYDIHINDWMDERYDPWKASVAAVKKLKWNYAQFNDWPLALAAYNCGVGAIHTAIKRAGKADYWYLSDKGYLKAETVYYVPKFLAIAEILSRSEEFNIDWGDPDEYASTVTITVKQAVDLGVFAKEIDLEPELIKKLNPSLHYAITPPHVNYPLRVPVQYEQAAQTVLHDADKLLLKYYRYRIKSGDTLGALSKHYGVSIATILQYNKGLKATLLQIGKTIIIPALKSVESYKGKRLHYPEDFNGRHTIAAGDTLWALALKYAVPVEVLAEKNNLTINSILKLGYSLKVPIPVKYDSKEKF